MKTLFVNMLIIALVMSVFCVNLRAQNVGFEVGIKGGADYSVSGIKNVDIKNPLKFHAGAYANVKILMLGLQVEALYGSKLVDSKNTLSALNVTEKELNYVNIPVLIEYHLPSLGFLTLQAGPQFGVLLSDNPQVPTQANSSTAKELYNKYDVALLVGLKFNISKFHLYARYVEPLKAANVVTNTSPSSQLQVGLEIKLFGKKIGL